MTPESGQERCGEDHHDIGVCWDCVPPVAFGEGEEMCPAHGGGLGRYTSLSRLREVERERDRYRRNWRQAMDFTGIEQDAYDECELRAEAAEARYSALREAVEGLRDEARAKLRVLYSDGLAEFAERLAALLSDHSDQEAKR